MAGSVDVELRAITGDFIAKMRGAGDEIERLQKNSTEHFTTIDRVATVGKTAFLGIAGAAVAGAEVALKAAADYQESLTQLVTGAGETKDKIGMVGAGMLKMAGQVGISAMDLSKGMYSIESAGFHGASGLDVLRAAAEGAKVGAADMSEVANGLTTVLSDYRLPASAAADVTSKLVTTVASGKTHMGDLSVALAAVLPTASSAKIGLDQVLGAMATMTSLGTPAADAATYLRQTIAQLENPTAKARHEMEALGLSSLDISENLGARGLTGTFDLLTNAIESKMGPAGTVLVESLKKSAGSTTAFQKVLANLPPTQQTYISALATMVGGTRSMQAALELTGAHAATFHGDVKRIGEASTEAGGHVKGFAETQKDLNTQLANARAALSSVAIEIGQKLLPVVTSMVEWLGKHRDVVLALAIAVGGVLTVAIATWVAGLVAAAATSVASLGLMVAAWLGYESTVVVGTAATEVSALSAFATMAAAGLAWAASMLVAGATAMLPFLPIIAIVAAVGIAAYELYKHWDQVWGFIKTITEAAWNDAIHPVLGWIGDGFQWLYNHVIAPVGHFIGTVWDDIGKGLQWVWNNVLLPVFNVFGGAFDNLGGALSAFWGYAGQVWDGISGLFKGGVNGLIGFVNFLIDFWDSLSFTFPGIKIPIPGIPDIPGFSFSLPRIPDIPKLAAGGIVTRATLAVIGEAGPEAVIPLDRAKGSGAAGGSGDMHVHVHLDDAVITDAQTARRLGALVADGVHEALLRKQARGASLQLGMR